jgi:hypothetical protein
MIGMKYLDKNSLFQTVDNVSEALLYDLKIDTDEKIEIADFILNQQGKPKTYADTFAPTENDLKHDLILFSGERIKTSAGKCHMIGEEASRILRKLGIQTNNVKVALQRADTGLLNRINKGRQDLRYEHGTYCCKSCTCALWINLASGGLGNDIKLLKAGLVYLKRNRDKKDRWIGYPYYYTLYILNEINRDLALDEMRYAAKSFEKRLKKKMSDENKYELRRNYICEKILEKVNSN